MPLSFESKRLRFRPLTQNDFEFMRSLHTDPEVMKYIGTGLTRTIEETKSGMAKMLALPIENPLLGAWVAIDQVSNEAVGNLMVRPPATSEKTEGLEIGYSFARAHWGRGFATEATLAMIDYIRLHFGSTRVVALIDPAHAASRRVLEKAGFAAAGTSTYVDPTTGVHKVTDVLELVAHYE